MLRAAEKWLPGYVRSVLSRPKVDASPRHLIFCVADHFEPFRGGATLDEARRRVAQWVEQYPGAVEGFADADGCGPRHTFFYPAEEYQAECLDRLAGLCRSGHGEVEVHLHHRDDTPGHLSQTLCDYRDRLSEQHGLLGRDSAGRARYGFVHGNWALCNSRPDGDWCGVDEELGILCRTGCYADFTFPSAPSPTQPRLVNAIYYARDGEGCPRGHDYGRPVLTSGPARPVRDSPDDGELMLIQGPLALDWRRRKWGLLPRLENAAITVTHPPTPERVDLWVRQNVHVKGRPAWTFVKVHTHGCDSVAGSVLLGQAGRQMHEYLSERYNDGVCWQLHYASARETYNIVRAAEDGAPGEPGAYRDYEVGAPSNSIPRNA